MIYSAGCEYAIRALTKLAGQARPGAFCLLRDILDGIDVPQHYVGKIFQTLVRAGILNSAKGRGGGFALQRTPEQILLRQITDAIDGPSRINRCILGLASCDEDQHCPQHDNWVCIRDQIDDLLDKTTLADVVRTLGEKEAKAGG